MDVNYRELYSLYGEFANFTESLHTLYLDSIVGYTGLHNTVVEHQNWIQQLIGECESTESASMDKCSVSYKDLCGVDYQVASLNPLMTEGEVKNRTQKNGRSWILLGQQCVVSAYTYWEEYLRNEILYGLCVIKRDDKVSSEELQKLLNEYVSDDFWGDIRCFRNSIIHNNSLAIDKIKNCKVLKWFQYGDYIALDYDKMRCFFYNMGIYRNKLHTMSFPQKACKINW